MVQSQPLSKVVVQFFDDKSCLFSSYPDAHHWDLIASTQGWTRFSLAPQPDINYGHWEALECQELFVFIWTYCIQRVWRSSHFCIYTTVWAMVLLFFLLFISFHLFDRDSQLSRQ